MLYNKDQQSGRDAPGELGQTPSKPLRVPRGTLGLRIVPSVNQLSLKAFWICSVPVGALGSGAEPEQPLSSMTSQLASVRKLT